MISFRRSPGDARFRVAPIALWLLFASCGSEESSRPPPAGGGGSSIGAAGAAQGGRGARDAASAGGAADGGVRDASSRLDSGDVAGGGGGTGGTGPGGTGPGRVDAGGSGGAAPEGGADAGGAGGAATGGAGGEPDPCLSFSDAGPDADCDAFCESVEASSCAVAAFGEDEACRSLCATLKTECAPPLGALIDCAGPRPAWSCGADAAPTVTGCGAQVSCVTDCAALLETASCDAASPTGSSAGLDCQSFCAGVAGLPCGSADGCRASCRRARRDCPAQLDELVDCGGAAPSWYCDADGATRIAGCTEPGRCLDECVDALPPCTTTVTGAATGEAIADLCALLSGTACVGLEASTCTEDLTAAASECPAALDAFVECMQQPDALSCEGPGGTPHTVCEQELGCVVPSCWDVTL